MRQCRLKTGDRVRHVAAKNEFLHMGGHGNGNVVKVLGGKPCLYLVEFFTGQQHKMRRTQLQKLIW